MNGSTFQTIYYINGSVFSKARYMIEVGFEILARTPVHQLPPKLHPEENNRELGKKKNNKRKIAAIF